MTRQQYIGLGLIILCGVLSQFTAVKQYPWAVWIIALVAIVGMVLVLWEWFKEW